MNIVFYILTLFGNNFHLCENYLSDELPVLEITKNGFTPKDGLELEEAKLLIIGEKSSSKELKKALKNIEVTEITIEKLWLSSPYQIYLVAYENPNEIVIIKDKKLVKRLPGWAIGKMFLADLDKDKKYEIYCNNSFGSGMINEEIIGYNISSKEAYILSERGERDYRLFLENNLLKVKVSSFEDRTQEMIGELEINEDYIPKLLVRLIN